ncbi:hypothetical protein [Desulfotomaculum sp. 1211_IL3151]|uniref:hypothetical protein n=1 Tax=Desulfotomaculum sp. 1211_IL3151 TaxID=3084055 RepID=UPI002FD8E8D4
MNEKQIQMLMQNLDNDLLAKELDDLTSDLEVDLDSITQKAFNKLNQERLKKKRKRFYPLVAACLITVIGISNAYAAEISDFVRSFFNQRAIYSTVIDGSAYYLESPLQLDKEVKLENVIFTKDKLDMNLTFSLIEDKLPEILVATANGKIYKPGGYGYDNDRLLLSFWNEVEHNYMFSPTEELKLIIGEKSYSIHLTEGVPVVGSGEINPAEKTNIDWVKVGYKKIDQGVQILTSFTDNDLKLVAIGEPDQNTVTRIFKNENGITSSGTSSMTKPLLGYGKDKNVYTYNQAKDAVGRPVTQFETQDPADTEIELKIPSLLVGYEKDFGNIDVAIPELNEEKRIDREIDLKLQKITLQSIKRTSATTAELKFALNTGDKAEVAVREVSLYSKDVQSGDSVWQGDVCTMGISFDGKLKNAQLNLSWPRFEVKGNWTLKIK